MTSNRFGQDLEKETAETAEREEREVNEGFKLVNKTRASPVPNKTSQGRRSNKYEEIIALVIDDIPSVEIDLDNDPKEENSKIDPEQENQQLAQEEDFERDKYYEQVTELWNLRLSTSKDLINRISFTNDREEHLAVKHFSVKGQLEEMAEHKDKIGTEGRVTQTRRDPHPSLKVLENDKILEDHGIELED
jgi:hypothetical protein